MSVSAIDELRKEANEADARGMNIGMVHRACIELDGRLGAIERLGVSMGNINTEERFNTIHLTLHKIDERVAEVERQLETARKIGGVGGPGMTIRHHAGASTPDSGAELPAPDDAAAIEAPKLGLDEVVAVWERVADPSLPPSMTDAVHRVVNECVRHVWSKTARSAGRAPAPWAVPELTQDDIREIKSRMYGTGRDTATLDLHFARACIRAAWAKAGEPFDFEAWWAREYSALHIESRTAQACREVLEAAGFARAAPKNPSEPFDVESWYRQVTPECAAGPLLGHDLAAVQEAKRRLIEAGVSVR